MATKHKAGNPMRKLRIEKVVVNIGVGETGERLTKAEKALQILTGSKPVRTISKTTNKDLGIRKRQPIGCKITLRKANAEKFLRNAFWVKENKIADYSFDPEGNFSFGIPDYTIFPGMKYDPEIGIFGMDISVTLRRAGNRVAVRRRARAKLPYSHRIAPKEAMEFVRNKFGVEVVTE
jgi:large subunit ribosomal protein L5